MRRRAVLMVMLLAAPVAARATRGRVALSLVAGGGYASDVFVGAGLGSDSFFQVTPGGRLDLSLAPRWKLAAAADLSYGRYFSSEFSSFGQSASLEGRWLAGESWELSLGAGGEHADYSLGVPDPDVPSSPSVSSTLAARLTALLRVRAAGFEWRAAGAAGTRSSSTGADTVHEDEGALLAGAMRRVSEAVALALTYKLGRTYSERPEFTFTSHALFGLVSWRARPVDLEAQLQLQTSKLGTGARDELGRVTASAAYPVTDDIAIEGVYAFTANRSDDAARPSATLHLAFLALRWRAVEATW